MKKLMLCVAVLFGGLSISARDFTYNGIVYTVTDEEARTVETKTGTTIPDPEDAEKEIRVAGNEVSGALVLPGTVFDENGSEYTLTRLGDDSFSNSDNLLSVTLPESISEVGDYAFYSCSWLLRINLPQSLKSIGKYAFFSCLLLGEIDIPDSITSIKDGTFAGCISFKTITLPENLFSIGDYAFMSCMALEEIKMPDYVMLLGNAAFLGCSDLKTVHLPKHLFFPGSLIFYSCSEIKTVYYPTDSPTTASKGIFDDEVYVAAKLIVPEGAKEVMMDKIPWKYFVDILEQDFNSIEDVTETEMSMPVEYFDLNGRKIASPAPGQIVIERQGRKARKIIF